MDVRQYAKDVNIHGLIDGRKTMPLWFIKIIMTLFAVSNFVPEYFAGIQPFAIIIKLSYYGYIVGILVEFFVDHRVEKKVTVWVVLYYVALGCSTVIYSRYNIPLLRSLIKSSVFTIVTINFFAKYIQQLSNYFLKICAEIGEVGALLNLIFIVLFPTGLFVTTKTGEACWLYGHKNSLLISIFIPLFASFIVYRDEKTDRISIRTFLLAFIVFLSGILSGASSIIVCMTLMILMMGLLNNCKLNRYVTIGKCICIPIIINVAISFFRVQKIFSFIIVDILGKDLTLSTRTTIWDYSLQYFAKSPIWGVGYLFPGDLYKMILLSGTHNFIIGILFHMGVLGIIIWIIAFGTIIYKNGKIKWNPIMGICATFLLVYFVQGITENIFAPVTELKGFLLLLMCYYLPDMDITEVQYES